MSKQEYAEMIRSMHRIIGWVFIGTVVLAPFGLLVLRRGNRIYQHLMTLEGDKVFEDGWARSLIMSFDDFTSTSVDGDD